MDRRVWTGALVALWTAAAVAAAGRPEDEYAAGFSVRFDAVPSEPCGNGRFTCGLEKDGTLCVRLKAQPTDLLGDYVLRSRDKVKAGEWHQVAFTFSQLRRRAALYLDGRFQWENDTTALPHLAAGAAELVKSRSEVKDFASYDYDCDSEALTRADDADRAAVRADLARLAAEVAADAGLAAWTKGLAARPDVTLADLRALRQDAANIRRIAGEKAGRFAACAVFSTDPTSQTPILPRTVPREAEFTGEMRVIAGRGEFEAAALTLVAYRPLTVKSVTVEGVPFAADVKLVKRWFRTGGAWLRYFADRRERVLVPDLLVNDDALIRVDETRRRNFLRLDYPTGTVWSDASDPARGHKAWDNDIPFRDADTLQPVTIGEAGRNQQFLLTFEIPKSAKAGLYEGRVVLATDAGDVALKASVNVLPVLLPDQGATYADTSRAYITHVNQLSTWCRGETLEKRLAHARMFLANLRDHGINHFTGTWSTPELVKIAEELGFVPDRVFELSNVGNDVMYRYWMDWYPRTDPSELTLKDREAGLRAQRRFHEPWLAYEKAHLPKGAKQYVHFLSEASAYRYLTTWQREAADLFAEEGLVTFAHGMNRENYTWASDIQDMHSTTRFYPEEISRWHAVGAEVVSYAEPFPGSENPMLFRRKPGFWMYKFGFDGHMLHGFTNYRIPFNEFAEDVAGDGNYRNFTMAYPMRDGLINTLALEGYREGMDDVKWATALVKLARVHRESADVDVRREARRALAWFDGCDCEKGDPTRIRRGIQRRILLLGDAIGRAAK